MLLKHKTLVPQMITLCPCVMPEHDFQGHWRFGGPGCVHVIHWVESCYLNDLICAFSADTETLVVCPPPSAPPAAILSSASANSSFLFTLFSCLFPLSHRQRGQLTKQPRQQLAQSVCATLTSFIMDQWLESLFCQQFQMSELLLYPYTSELRENNSLLAPKHLNFPTGFF